MTNQLKLSNGIILVLTPAAEPRIKDSFIRAGAVASDDFVRILTRTIKGARELTRELRAWGATVDALGPRTLKVSR
jgi:hypothetical protein